MDYFKMCYQNVMFGPLFRSGNILRQNKTIASCKWNSNTNKCRMDGQFEIQVIINRHKSYISGLFAKVIFSAVWPCVVVQVVHSTRHLYEGGHKRGLITFCLPKAMDFAICASRDGAILNAYKGPMCVCIVPAVALQFS